MQWQKLLECCVSETNPDELTKLVFETEDAIYFRFHDVSGKSEFSDEFEALRQAAKVLLEIKTKKLGWPDPLKMTVELNGSDKPNITLAGRVQKVIPGVYGEPEKIEISVQTADALYREIRIENALQDGGGKPIALKLGTEVDVTIEADHEDTNT